MKQLLEEMIWLYIQNLMATEFRGAESPEALNLILAAANERCFGVLKEAGIISSYQVSLAAVKAGTELWVDVALPTNLGDAPVPSGEPSPSAVAGV